MRRLLAPFALLLLAAAPAPGKLQTYRDWVVGCDNQRRCTAASLGGDTADFPAYTLSLTRAPGPGGGFDFAIEAGADDAAPPAAIVVDGRRFPVAPGGLAGPAAARLARAIAQGRTLTLVARDGGRLGTIAPAGAAAALRYIDAQQGRAGTVTAIVARGTRGAASVPAAAALPVITAPRLAGVAARPTPAQIATMRRQAECDPENITATLPPRTAALGGGATMVLLPCSAGAYNEIDALFVIRDGRVAAAEVDAPAGFDATGADSQTPVRSVVNGGFDGGAVTSYAKGRGLGDCGLSQSFVWDGTRLRLTDQSEMDECRGNPNFVTTWRARVVRR